MRADEIRNDAIEGDLTQVFNSHQQQFRAALEESAGMLRDALLTQKSIYEQLNQGVANSLPESTANSSDDTLQPFSVEAMQKAYQRAGEIFSGIERAAAGAQAGAYLPQSTLPSFDSPGGNAPADPVAASVLLVTQATDHLNAAMESFMKTIDRRLSKPGPTEMQPPEAGAGQSPPAPDRSRQP
jgi:hypothetical protein